jgi:hypothetical protein
MEWSGTYRTDQSARGKNRPARTIGCILGGYERHVRGSSTVNTTKQPPSFGRAFGIGCGGLMLAANTNEA